ncbi:MAG TPA: HAMP domain-containing sensor histidine kinase [Phycisphaerae bacterium]|nr:HAMP domain-containing sensor histidine kinase [Phycisphaerae bacterium]HNU46088.1 HAMP domain-containing sensor histidine kinase [Phycisphaerae bacterium]
MSLAPKLSLLFGAAVLLTIAVTLLFPWLQMAALDQQALLLQAKQVAAAAYQSVDVEALDWQTQQEALQRCWPLLARDLGLPLRTPELVPLVRTTPTSAPPKPDAFQQSALEHFTRHRNALYYWQGEDEQGDFRLALAVRARDAEPLPRLLRGLIDVRLSVTPHLGVWNVVVTALAGASGAVLAVLVFYMVTQRLVLSRVQALRRVAEQVTSGDIEIRSALATGDEFQELGQTFNEMLTHLRAAQDDLRKINRSLDVRLGELAEINVALYESNRVKSDFLANVSHELRTPLASIIGFAELLRDAWENPKADRARLARYSENILTSGRSLLDIINDLLDLAKIEAGKLDLHLSEFSLAELCMDLIDFVRPLADKRNQDLGLELAPELPRCRSDAGKVKQILYNLLSNAVKFTPPGGVIRLRVSAGHGDFVRLTVSDTGPGIPPEQQQAIFEKFHQLDSSRTREYEGTGLGLAITRELAHMLGGRIELESTPGQGATFIVYLPVLTPTPQERPGRRAAEAPSRAGRLPSGQ